MKFVGRGFPGQSKWWVWLATAGAVACGPSGLAKTALEGDLEKLSSEIAAARKSKELPETEVRDLAHAVATRELLSSRGDAGVARVRELRPCINRLVAEFEERSEGKDAGAAAAQLALLEAGRADADDLMDSYASATEPDWRAVAARAAIGPQHGDYRRKAFLDGDLRVRRAALHAALAQPVSADLEAAFEAARLDPDPLVRSLAVRLMGAIGGRTAVGLLRDVWGRAEPETRQAIVDAWANSSSYDVGGSEQLLWAMETQKGLPAIVAAARLAASSSPQRSAAVSVLVRAMDQGPVDEQRLAILLAPTAPELLPTIQKLSQSEDLQAAVMASAALGRHASEREVARKRLQKLAHQRQVRISRQARAALVTLGDQSIAGDLTKELESEGWERRRQAAVDLLRLGEYQKMVSVLADPVASVRTRVACEILTRS